MPELKVTLEPVPPLLRPNYEPGTKRGRIGQAAQRKAYRKDAGWAWIAANRRQNLEAPLDARLGITLYHRDRRGFYDPANVGRLLKAAIDGIVDAGILEDDNRLQLDDPVQLVDPDNPRVELRLYWPGDKA